MAEGCCKTLRAANISVVGSLPPAVSGLLEESSFSPGCSDVQLPEPQIIPAQQQIHRGHRPPLYFAFLIWSDPQRAVPHPVSQPVGPSVGPNAEPTGGLCSE